MSTIKYRKLDFRFDDDIAFQFHPGSSAVSDFVNALTFTAPAFEPYFIRAFNDALPLINDERLRADTRLFMKQESQHTRHHVAHLAMLLRKFPELEEVRDAINHAYRTLYETRPLRFHLAYTATVELAFGPIARFIIANRDALLAGGDDRISSFVLWHFVEEFEHRNCAIDVFRSVVGSHAYRLSTVRETLRHLKQMNNLTTYAFARLAAEGRIAPLRGTVLDPVPRAKRWRLGRELFGTLLPWHRPDHLDQPSWLTGWLDDEAAGKSMLLAYQSPP
jgi:predicted metal-dependent hydrolase